MSADLLDVTVVVEGDSVTARLKGSAEGEAVKTLESALSSIQAKVREASASTAILDIRDLEFATSSALKVLANWLMEAAEQAVPRRVQFLSNTKHSWQRRSLQAIASIVPGVVEIRTEA